MPSYKIYTVSISDFLYLAEYLAPEKDRSFHLRVLSVIDSTRDGYITKFEFFTLLALLLPKSITAPELVRRMQRYINK
ncbi:hypothetical protein JH06_5388 [Blastocystis sp. subtype 4]|uniref:hypothetical protein n=1 Tax=Blastocystis sp. subtype 4 TaxID=944170 RepID=UPI0007119E78|nr:hypothetical protein JH06_5388 [Blastocystis sp. subtype 4]KNB41759.1 hypothetical protein JH06_5388 [Blastocystis sp. subtype 4]|eukprot:XP_014525202.1 hypothetical protein JH06_5388 [Blastocystis sp. subtype 4]